ncbi:energy-coupled thiamine transporter ThiT [Acetanaerobacterium elongatum]|uniref:Thiamine transporter n=1 Tax=Acetanaerobacterium elongatum TaxID=258515 RepID=A0A1G9WUP3_9FIRM|nr:energy-coupled thiamine transporter ThiT [Acetanaerobacterium elongatum]SDM88272.1 thiamine transporter [Acetanaerobacterium elongatum]
MEKNKTRLLAESGLMIALAAILSLIKFIPMPYGGSVTLCSMLPIMLISYRNGIKWGLFTGFAYGIVQLILDIPSGIFKGVTLGSVVGVILFDYLIAFTCLGLAGLFRKAVKNPSLAILCGVIVSGLLRYLSHAISGFIFYSSYAEWFFSQEGFTLGQNILNKYSGTTLSIIYTLFYNGTFMIPEIIITAVVAVLVGGIFTLTAKKAAAK